MSDEIIIDHSQPPADDHSMRIDHSPQPLPKAAPDKQLSSDKPTSTEKTATTPSAMQTVVQINVYREKGGQFEFLLLKRIDHDDKFWQPVTEPVLASSTLADTLRQAASEQIGVHGFKHLSHEMHSYEWYAHGERGRDIVFAAELSLTAAITPDSSRFSTYQWFNAEQAILHLKWNGNKDAIRNLNKHLVSYRRTHPLPLTTGLYDAAVETPSADPLPVPTPSLADHNQDDPEKPQGPPQHPTNQRLPDVPSSSTNDTSALFL